jgi:hypothetical protein
MECEFCKAPLLVVRPPPPPPPGPAPVPTAMLAMPYAAPAPVHTRSRAAGPILAVVVIAFVAAGGMVAALFLATARPSAPPPPLPIPVTPEPPPPVIPTTPATATEVGILAMFDAQCNAGDAQSCVAIGQMYEHGQMAPADKTKALSYYARGCALGNSGACSLRDTLSRSKRK